MLLYFSPYSIKSPYYNQFYKFTVCTEKKKTAKCQYWLDSKWNVNPRKHVPRIAMTTIIMIVDVLFEISEKWD